MVRSTHNPRELGRLISTHRLAAGLSRRQLVERVNELDGSISYRHLSRIEAGTAPPPRLDRIIRIARALEVDVAQLIPEASP